MARVRHAVFRPMAKRHGCLTSCFVKTIRITFPGPDVWGTEGIGPIPSGGISQPPVAATFVRSIWEQNKDFGSARVAELLPKIKAWHEWFMTWRTSSEGAVFLTHPWEAGRDNSPDWDSSMAMINPEGVGEYSRRDTSHVDPAMRPTKDEYDRYLWLVLSRT